MEKAREALGLLRSIILSGEPWTPSAEATFAAALAEVEEWEARLANLKALVDLAYEAITRAEALARPGEVKT